jgi:hypothetical protein
MKANLNITRMNANDMEEDENTNNAIDGSGVDMVIDKKQMMSPKRTVIINASVGILNVSKNKYFTSINIL